MNEKRILRQSVPRTPLTEEEQAQLNEKVFEHPLWKNADKVFVYISEKPEPDTAAIIEKAFAEGKTVAVPLCVDRSTMRAVVIGSTAELADGKYGPMEPPSGNADMEGDFLAVMPCVACSVDRVRLGRGMGYYDAFLAQHPVRSICLCRDEALLNYIPGSNHDILPDAVITQTRVIG